MRPPPGAGAAAGDVVWVRVAAGSAFSVGCCAAGTAVVWGAQSGDDDDDDDDDNAGSLAAESTPEAVGRGLGTAALGPVRGVAAGAVAGHVAVRY